MSSYLAVAEAKGRLLRRYREEAGMSRRALAADVGVSAKTIERWEGGQTSVPRPYWETLENVLKLQAQYLREEFDSLEHRGEAGRAANVALLLARGLGGYPPGLKELVSRVGATEMWPSTGTLLHGPADFVAAAVRLADIAHTRLQSSADTPGAVQHVSGSWFRRLLSNPDHAISYKQAIQVLLADGWAVQHIWCGSTLPAFDEWVIDFLGFPGTYQLLVHARTAIIPSYDLLHVPGVGGYLAFVEPSESDTVGWFYLAATGGSHTGSELMIVERATKHAFRVARPRPAAQITIHSRRGGSGNVSQGDVELEEMMADAEEEGVRSAKRLVKYGLPEPLQPRGIVEGRRRRRISELGPEASASQQISVNAKYAAILRQVIAAERQVVQGELRVICPKDALDRFLEDGNWPSNRWWDMTSGSAPEYLPFERVAVLDYVVSLLEDSRTSGHLKIALVDAPRGVHTRCQWETVGEELFFSVRVHGSGDSMERYGSGPQRRRVSNMIGERPIVSGSSRDPDVVGTFVRMFEDMWKDISPSASEPTIVVRAIKDALERSRPAPAGGRARTKNLRR